MQTESGVTNDALAVQFVAGRRTAAELLHRINASSEPEKTREFFKAHIQAAIGRLVVGAVRIERE